MTDLWSDIRWALRQHARSKGATALTVLTLAVGIGGASAVFGVYNSLFLRPLPFVESERLVDLAQRAPPALGG